MNTFEAQTWLKELGFPPGPIDGIWGSNTQTAARNFLVSRKVKVPPRGTLLVAVEQQVMKEVGGINVGVVDGIVGPVTRAARNKWLVKDWRSVVDKPQQGDSRFPNLVKTVWPLESKMREFYGAPGTGHVSLELPFPMVIAWDTKATIRRFTIHNKCHDSAKRVYTAVLVHYGYDEIKRLGLDMFGGCFNDRVKRGGSSLSTHAYAAAIDTDPVNNALRASKATARMARPEYAAWWDAWSAEGWLSLGKARDYDWMHVQAARLG